MKKIVHVALLLLATLTLASNTVAKPQKQSLDQMIAIINDDVITRTELNRSIVAAKAQISQENLPMPADSILKKQVLDQLINKKLQLQLAKQANIQITDEEISKAIANIAKQNNISVSELYQHVNSEGMSTDEYRNEIRDQMTLQRLQQQEIAGKITITEHEISAFLNSKSWQTHGTNEYRIEDILIPFSDDTPSPDQIAAAKKRAYAVLNKIKSGQHFQDVAQTDSVGKSALQGGDLGWRKLPEIPNAFVEKITLMKKNDVAGPIQTPNGFHVILLADIRSSTTQQSAPSRKMVESLLLQRKFEEAVQNWVSKMRNQAYIVNNLND